MSKVIDDRAWNPIQPEPGGQMGGGLLGAPLGVLALDIVPDFPATDYLTAIAVGIVSGLAATGINQVFKQLREN